MRATTGLGALDEPPVPMPRTREQQEQDLRAARKVLKLAFEQASDSEDLRDRKSGQYDPIARGAPHAAARAA